MKKALLQLHAAVFLWGFTGVLGRAITLDSVLLVWYRLAITVATLWLLYALRKQIKKITGILHYLYWYGRYYSGAALGVLLRQY